MNEIFYQILQILSRASLPASLGLTVAIDTSESVGPFLFFFVECLLTISIKIPLVYWSPLVPEFQTDKKVTSALTSADFYALIHHIILDKKTITYRARSD